MAQYREYHTTVRISSGDIVLTSRFGTYELSDRIVRDGSEETNFKAACWAHRNSVGSLPASSTSPPCYPLEVGRWIAEAAISTVITNTSTIKVPAGNSGVLRVDLDTDDYDTFYKIGAGSWTTFSSGGTITVTDGNLLSFKVESLPENTSLNASVKDTDTELLVDSISLMNTAPTPP